MVNKITTADDIALLKERGEIAGSDRFVSLKNIEIALDSIVCMGGEKMASLLAQRMGIRLTTYNKINRFANSNKQRKS
jgi:hypothetical protein